MPATITALLRLADDAVWLVARTMQLLLLFVPLSATYPALFWLSPRRLSKSSLKDADPGGIKVVGEFLCRCQSSMHPDAPMRAFVFGYCNVTTTCNRANPGPASW